VLADANSFREKSPDLETALGGGSSFISNFFFYMQKKNSQRDAIFGSGHGQPLVAASLNRRYNIQNFPYIRRHDVRSLAKSLRETPASSQLFNPLLWP
jgi:hypothetical protein